MSQIDGAEEMLEGVVGAKRPQVHAPAARSEVRLGSLGWAALSALVSAVMVALQLPFARLKFDDFIHRAALRGHPSLPFQKWDMFHFFSGDPISLRAAQDAGFVPWFVDPELKLAFLRPLSSALIVLDDALFGSFAQGYLLHGGLWYLALCTLVALWYQKLLPGLRGGLASIAFVVAGAHHEVVSWFSARNALVAAVFGMLALLAYQRWRERGDVWARFASAAALVLALSAGEAGLGVVAFIAAYEWTTRAAPLGQRLRALAPTLAVAASYLALHAALGYGTHGSGAYINPLHEPLAYLAALPQRFLFSLGVLLLGVPADLWFFAPAARSALTLVGLAAALLGALWLLIGARRLPDGDRATLRLLSLAMLGSLLPQLAGPLGPRSYLLASSAALGLLTLGVDQALRSKATPPRRYLAWAAGGLVAALHLLGGPFLWLEATRFETKLLGGQGDRERELDLGGPLLGEQDYLLLSVPDPVFGIYLPFMRHALGLPAPARWRLLSLAECDQVVVRTSARTFELELSRGDLIDASFAEIFRGPARTFRVGEQVPIDGLSARILELSPRGQPRRIEFTTRRDLDDPRLRLFGWDGGHMQPIHLVQGERRTLRWP
jgi:hypothetical protein